MLLQRGNIYPMLYKTRKVRSGVYEIVGKASKANEDAVIAELKKDYSR